MLGSAVGSGIFVVSVCTGTAVVAIGVWTVVFGIKVILSAGIGIVVSSN
jgi:hypothetical protein